MIQKFLKGIIGKNSYTKKQSAFNYSQKSSNSLMDEIASIKNAEGYYSILNKLPNPDPVLRKQGKSISVYRELLSDPHVGAVADSRKAGVLSLEWSIDRGKAQTKQTKFIQDIFDDLDIYTFISDILEAPLYGYQPIEIIWENVGNYIVPAKLVAKPQEWFFFDTEGNLRFREKGNSNGRLILPEEKKFLLPRYKPKYMNPYGEAVLSRCFWNVIFKKSGWEFWVEFLEKYAIPHYIGKHDRGASDEEIKDLGDMLENMVQDAIAVIPNDSSIEIKEASGKGASSQIFDKFIDKCEQNISKAILGQTLTTQVGDKGSYAVGKVHSDVRQDIIDADKMLAVSSCNQLIRWIDEINFNSSELPEFSMWKEEDVDKDLAERDGILAEKTGIKFTKKYYMKAYGYEEEDIEIITETKPANFSEFSSNTKNSSSFKVKETYPDQKDIENLISSFNDSELQNSFKDVLNPILSLFNQDPNLAMEKLAEVYPDMDSSELEKILANLIFVSEIWGRLNA